MIKKLIFLLLFLLLLPIRVQAISAESAILIDGDSGRVLFAQNAYEKKLIASTTKIMTALVAIENGKLDKKIKVDEKVLKAYGSAIYIEVGEKITLKDLLYGLMLRSGNDAALVIAGSVCKNEKEFVKLMNQKAEDYDMALLMKEAMQNKTFQEITKTKSYTAKTNKKTYTWKNKNKLLYNYKYTTGGKTGFTKKARRTLVTSAQKGQKKLIAVTLNDPNDFFNHEQLYEQYFKKYNLVKVIDSKKYTLQDKKYPHKKLYLKNDINILLTKEEEKKIEIDINIDENKTASNMVGTLEVKLDNKTLSKENIYLKEVKKNHKNTIWKTIKSWFS